MRRDNKAERKVKLCSFPFSHVLILPLLVQLSNLVRLFAAINQMLPVLLLHLTSGTIPESLGQLFNLIHLNLSYNLLSGEASRKQRVPDYHNSLLLNMQQ